LPVARLPEIPGIMLSIPIPMYRLRRLLLLASLSATFSFPATAQPGSVVRALLDSAAARFAIPRPILYGVAYAESRWRFVPPGEMTSPCDGRPPSFGVMGLHDDDYFGHSLRAGAPAGVSAESAAQTLEGNITAGACHLASLFDGGDRNDPAAWLPAVGRYPGIPASQQVLRDLYVDGVLTLLRAGWHYDDGQVEPCDVPTIDRNAIRHGLATMGADVLVPDYPGAIWEPSPNFSGRDGSAITAIAIHDTEGEFAGSVSWLLSTESQASAHYVIRSSDGFTVQLVAEAEKAWHVRSENPYTIGIEHEGFVDRPEYFTQTMYRASADLVRAVSARYAIPLDRTRIKGHLDFPNNTHTDPGGWWDWPGYYRLIARDPSLAVAIDRFEDTVVGWWQPSHSGSTVGVDPVATTFAITPSTAYAGAAGAELRYRFTGADGGVARVFRSGHGNTTDGLLNLGESTSLSLMVKGDGGGNALELWLYDSTKANLVLPVGPVTWTGWRRVSASLGGLPGPRPLRFHSVVVRQIAGKSMTGVIGFDDLTAERGTS
jgi:hypothetical protein